MRNHEMTSVFTSTTPKYCPANMYFMLYHHGCFNSEVLMQTLSRERTSKSVFRVSTKLSFTSIASIIFYKRKRYGSIKLAIIIPPTIKKIVATSDDHCILDNPIIEWPEVQPPAYLVPNPTRKPPATIKINPLIVSNCD